MFTGTNREHGEQLVSCREVRLLRLGAGCGGDQEDIQGLQIAEDDGETQAYGSGGLQRRSENFSSRSPGRCTFITVSVQAKAAAADAVMSETVRTTEKGFRTGCRRSQPQPGR